MKFYSTLDGVLATTQNLSGEFLHVYDTMTSDQISCLIEKNGAPAVILNDHMTLTQTLPSNIFSIFLPLFAAKDAGKWHKNEFRDELPKTLANFCFMGNKKSLNRSLCLKIIEIFGLTNFLYSWSGLGRSMDMTIILQELETLGQNFLLTDKQKSALLAPIDMPEHVIGRIRSKNNSHMVIIDHRTSWQDGLDQIFSNSAVNLITETYTLAHETIFTEKTLYSVLGLNLPIWVGGFGQADHWQSFGFDIFDDIIDHSYQYKSTLIERCWNAIFLNRDILENFDLAESIRIRCADRLISNRDLLLSGQLLRYCIDCVDKMPAEYQHHARQCIKLVCKI